MEGLRYTLGIDVDTRAVSIMRSYLDKDGCRVWERILTITEEEACRRLLTSETTTAPGSPL